MRYFKDDHGNVWQFPQKKIRRRSRPADPNGYGDDTYTWCDIKWTFGPLKELTDAEAFLELI